MGGVTRPTGESPTATEVGQDVSRSTFDSRIRSIRIERQPTAPLIVGQAEAIRPHPNGPVALWPSEKTSEESFRHLADGLAEWQRRVAALPRIPGRAADLAHTTVDGQAARPGDARLQTMDEPLQTMEARLQTMDAGVEFTEAKSAVAKPALSVDPLQTDGRRLPSNDSTTAPEKGMGVGAQADVTTDVPAEASTDASIDASIEASSDAHFTERLTDKTTQEKFVRANSPPSPVADNQNKVGEPLEAGNSTKVDGKAKNEFAQEAPPADVTEATTGKEHALNTSRSAPAEVESIERTNATQTEATTLRRVEPRHSAIEAESATSPTTSDVRGNTHSGEERPSDRHSRDGADTAGHSGRPQKPDSDHALSRTTTNRESATGIRESATTLAPRVEAPAVVRDADSTFLSHENAVLNRLSETLDDLLRSFGPQQAEIDPRLGPDSSRFGSTRHARPAFEFVRHHAFQLARSHQGQGEAWRTVQMELEEGKGSIVIRARKETKITRVTLEITDPSVRSSIEANLDRLRSNLEHRYGRSVDLSFGQGDPGSETGDRNQTRRSRNEKRIDSITVDPRAGETSATAATHVAADDGWVG